jgi:hypothetical protein
MNARNLSDKPFERQVSTARRSGGRPPKTASWRPAERRFTRGDVARYLGVNVSTVRRLEARGELHPHIGAGGIRYFSVWELDEVEKRRIAAARVQTVAMKLAAFELFRAGVDWRDVAIKLRYDPYRVYRLWRLYCLDQKSKD